MSARLCGQMSLRWQLNSSEKNSEIGSFEKKYFLNCDTVITSTASNRNVYYKGQVILKRKKYFKK